MGYDGVRGFYEVDVVVTVGSSVTPQPDERALPFSEQLFNALSEQLDETDAAAALDAIEPLAKAHGHAEYERGIEYGIWTAQNKIARQMGFDMELLRQ